jgi:ribokinase
MSAPKVIVAGEIFVDLLMIGLDAWPTPGKEIFAHSFRREIGGGTAITASALGRLGCESGVLAAVGADYGDWTIERLNRTGVRTETISREAGDASGFTVIATRPEDRAFITYPGANRAFPRVLRNWIETALDFPRHIHFSAPLCLDEAAHDIASIRQRGASVSLDSGWNEEWLSDKRAWTVAAMVDIFFPNEVEAARMTGHNAPGVMLETFADRGVEHVVLKLGTNGAAMLWDGAVQRVNPIQVKCVDTTGAGDCFDAGFLHFWLSGAPPIECLRAANICGALSTEHHGGIAGAPSLDRLKAELRKLNT